MERVCIGVYYLFFYEDGDEPFFGLRVAGQDTIKIYKVKEPPYKSRRDGFVCKANKSYVVCTNGTRGLREYAKSMQGFHLNRMTLDHLMDWVNYNTHIVRVEEK